MNRTYFFERTENDHVKKTHEQNYGTYARANRRKEKETWILTS